MSKIRLFQIISLSILIFLGAGISNAASFSDVYGSHANTDAIEYVKGNNIVSGYPDGTYKPDRTINRAEFTKIIVGARYDSYVIDNCITDNVDASWSYVFFPDVTKDAWYAKYICVARTHNIIQGYSSGYFLPAQEINFAEASKIIVNTFGYSVNSGQNWYQPYVERLGEKKAIPTTITDFNKRITRGEMAEMIYRLKANVLNKPTATYNSIAGLPETQNTTVKPNKSDTVPEQTITCNAANKSGNDGTYLSCIGKTITHQPSGLVAKLLTVSDSKVELSISELPGNNVINLRVYKNGTSEIGGNNNYAVGYKYNEMISSNGASISISSRLISVSPIADDTPISTPTPESVVDTTPDTPSVIISDVPKKFLNVIFVRTGDESVYETTPLTGVFAGSNNDVQVFEVIMWASRLNSNPRKISLYKLNKPYNCHRTTGEIMVGQEFIDCRESYNIFNIDVKSNAMLNYEQYSAENLAALKSIIQLIVKFYPAEHYGIKQEGHGSAGSTAPIFGYRLSQGDAEKYFSYFNSIIGKKIDFFDLNPVCVMATFSLLKSQYQYIDYIFASDLERGTGVPIPLGGVEWSDLSKLIPEMNNYPSYFLPSKSIKQSLIDLSNSIRLSWEYDKYKTPWTENKWKQSLSIFDNSKLQTLLNIPGFEDGLPNCTKIDSSSCDILQYIKENFPDHVQKFYDLRFHYISDKDFFPWDADYNGLRYVF